MAHIGGDRSGLGNSVALGDPLTRDWEPDVSRRISQVYTLPVLAYSY